MNNTRAFEGIWIPKEIWLSKDLTLQEKVFYVEIKSLDNDKGCFANNQYFAEFFDLSKVRVSEIINSLVEKGYLESTVNQAMGNKRILTTLIKESLRPSQRKVCDPHKETFIHNNTVSNTKNKDLNLAETAQTPKQEESVSVKSEHAKGMEFLHKTLGAFPDGGAQGKALKWMLGQGATLKEIQDGLVRHVREVNGKYRPSYTTLQKIIFQWAKPLPEKQYFKIDIEKEEDEYDRRIASQSGSSGR